MNPTYTHSSSKIKFIQNRSWSKVTCGRYDLVLPRNRMDLEQIVSSKTRPHVLSNVLSLMSVYLRVFKEMIITMTTLITDVANSFESVDHVGSREKHLKSNRKFRAVRSKKPKETRRWDDSAWRCVRSSHSEKMTKIQTKSLVLHVFQKSYRSSVWVNWVILGYPRFRTAFSTSSWCIIMHFLAAPRDVGYRPWWKVLSVIYRREVVQCWLLQSSITCIACCLTFFLHVSLSKSSGPSFWTVGEHS